MSVHALDRVVLVPALEIVLKSPARFTSSAIACILSILLSSEALAECGSIEVVLESRNHLSTAEIEFVHHGDQQPEHRRYFGRLAEEATLIEYLGNSDGMLFGRQRVPRGADPDHDFFIGRSLSRARLGNMAVRVQCMPIVRRAWQGFRGYGGCGCWAAVLFRAG